MSARRSSPRLRQRRTAVFDLRTLTSFSDPYVQAPLPAATRNMEDKCLQFFLFPRFHCALRSQGTVVELECFGRSLEARR